MASDLSFVEYVAEQIAAAGRISFRKMFGEYALYCDGKVVSLVCDNRFFVKPTAAGRALLPKAKEGFPFPGAKPWLVVDEWLDDDEFMAKLVRMTAAELPAPRTKAVKQAKTARPGKTRKK